MKKHRFRRLIATCMLGVFTISLSLFGGGGTEALASDEQPKTGNITIQNAIEGATYNFYRIADLKMTDSGNPEDGVSYTMSPEQYRKYKYLVYDYDGFKDEYDYYKAHPEEWETWMGDYETEMKNYEEALASPITVTGVDGVDEFVFYIYGTPEESTESINKKLQTLAPEYFFVSANGQVIADNLQLGYYIIVPEGKYVTAEDAVIPINLTNIIPDKVVKSKAAPLTITKTADITNASVGDIVTFTIEGKIPVYYERGGPRSIIEDGYASKFYVVDTIQGMKLTGDWSLTINGYPAYDYWLRDFTYNSLDPQWTDPEFLEDYKAMIQAQPEDFDAITIHGNRAEDIKSALTNITIPTAQGTSFTLGYRVSKNDYGKSFKLTYSAIVIEEAIRGIKGNINDAMAVYIDKTFYGMGYEIYTAEDQETVYTYDMNLLKYADGDTSKVLPGAQFALYKQDEDGNKLYYKLTEDATLEEGKDLTGQKVTWVNIGDKTINRAIADGDITAVTSGQDGKTAFTGIPHDTYYLQEVKAPNGYNLMAEDKVVDLAADAPADFEVQVENTGGALLPETGGPGTALFTMMGLLLMAGTSTIYLTQRKRHQS